LCFVPISGQPHKLRKVPTDVAGSETFCHTRYVTLWIALLEFLAISHQVMRSITDKKNVLRYSANLVFTDGPPGRRCMHSRLFYALAVLVLSSVAVYGQPATRNPEKEQLILGRLARAAPGAVETFRRGTEAMDKGDYVHAVQLYREVTQQAPTFSPALRRLGFSLAVVGQTNDGLSLLENAVSIERSPENLASLAQVLAYPSREKEGTQAQRERALTLAEEANEKYQGSDDASYCLLTRRSRWD
jgi:hypothetical protein